MQFLNKPVLFFVNPSWLLFHQQVDQKAAFALISIQEQGKKYYLLQWNEKWQQFNFIGGKLDNPSGDNDDLARTIRREIAEEIGIDNLDKVMAIQEKKQVRLCQYSLREERFKNYLFGVFEVSFFPYLSVDQQKVTHSLVWLTSHHKNIYVSVQEIVNLRTNDNKPISKTVHHLLGFIGEISWKDKIGALHNYATWRRWTLAFTKDANVY